MRPSYSQRAIRYATQPKECRTSSLRNALVEGAAWIAVTQVVALARKTNTWEQAEDQIQAALVAIMRAAETYDPSKGASFVTHATHWARPAVSGVLRHDRTDNQFPLDTPMAGDDDPDRPIRTLEIPDPAGSVLDVLVSFEEEEAQRAGRENTILRTRQVLDEFRKLTPAAKELVRRDSGLGVKRFGQALHRLRQENGESEQGKPPHVAPTRRAVPKTMAER